MSSVDNRVVAMKFDNAQFEKGVSTTLKTLDDLKSKLNFSGSAKGLNDLQAASKNFSLEGIASGVDSLAHKFSTLGIIGITALTNIVNKAMNAGTQLVKSLSLDPIMSGFHEYELKIGSIQTILANTARHGTTLSTVNSELGALNDYADRTIYSFAEMTKNASLFTNSGMKIEDATTAIKGFSNVAAASGTNAEGAANAAYQLSQALSAGQIRLMDWRSLTNVGMGGKNMQESIIKVAEAMGTLTKGSDTAKLATKDFNSSLEKKWLTADVMSQYLKIMSGDMTDAEYAALKMDKATVAALKKEAATAFEAATKVRTFTQLLSTVKEAIGSGWTDSFEFIFGNFEQATKLFTSINDKIGKIVQKSSQARNHVLHAWQTEGGRTAIIDSIRNAFTALGSVLKPIHDAFRAVFPAKTGAELAQISFRIREFTQHLILGKDKADKLKRTFQGVFSLFKIGTTIIGGIVRTFFSLFSVAGTGTGGILSLTAAAGDFLVKLQKWITTSGAIKKFFDGLIAARTNVLVPMVKFMSLLADAFASLLQGDISGFPTMLGKAFGSVGDIVSGYLQNVANAFSKVSSILSGGANLLSNFASTATGGAADLARTLASLASAASKFVAGFSSGAINTVIDILGNLSGVFKNLHVQMNFEDSLQSMNSGLSGVGNVAKGVGGGISGIGEALKGIWNGVAAAFSSVGSGLGPVISGLAEFFGTLIRKITDFVRDMDFQDLIALVNTAFFIALYNTTRKFLKSMDKMTEAISGTFKQLTKSLKTMQQDVKANIILKIAIAVGLLAAAVYVLSGIDPKALAFALGGLTVLFAQLAAMLAIITKINPKHIAGASVGLVMIATAIVILVGAIKLLGEMKWEVLRQGFGALAAMLIVMTLIVKFMSGATGIVLAATGLLILSTALTALSGVLILYSLIPWDTLKDGLKNIAISLSVLILAMSLATGALPGAAALLVMSFALATLAPVLVLFGKMPWKVIWNGIRALALVLLVLSVALYALTPTIAVLATFAGSILLAGAGLALAGAGMGLFAAGLTALAASGAAGFAVLVLGLENLLNLLPLFGKQLGYAFVAFVIVIGESLGQIVGVFVKFVLKLMDAIDAIQGRILTSIGNLIEGIALEIAKRAPRIFAAGLDMMMGFLRAIRDRTEDMTNIVIDILTIFITTLANRIGQIIEAGVNFIIAFLNGLAKAIREHGDEVAAAGLNIARAIIEGIGRGLTALGHIAVNAIMGLGWALIHAFLGLFGIHSPSTVFADIAKKIIEGLVSGFTMYVHLVVTAIKIVSNKLIDVFKGAFKLFENIAKTIINGLVSGFEIYLHLVITAITTVWTKLTDAFNGVFDVFKGIAKAIIDGLVSGLSGLGHLAVDALKSVGTKMYKGFTGLFKISSPSKVFEEIGININQGLAKGLLGSSDSVQAAYDQTKKLLSDAMKSSAEDIAKAKNKLLELTDARDKDNAAIIRAQQALATAKKSKNPKDDQTALDKLNKLIETRDKNTKAIQETTAALNQAKVEHAAEVKGYTALTTQLVDETRKLKSLANQYEAFNVKIEAANKTLEDAIKTRDDYNKSIRDQYGDLPDITKETKLTDYITGLQQKAIDTNKFAEALQQLRNLGLSDEMYQELLTKGVDSMPFVQELVKGGAASVAEINKAGSELAKAATALGTTASSALYQAGVDSAQGIVKGLVSQQGAIYTQMQTIAKTMVTALQTALKIKSPSKIFMKMGAFSMEGLTKGLKDSSSSVENAAAGIGLDALEAMRKSLSMMEDLVDGNLDLQPTITPLLDLTNMRKEALKMSSMLDVSPISVDSAYSSAKNASIEHRNKLYADLDAASREEIAPANVTFIQNNTSPKILSTADIYRQTKNQLSVAKGALTK